LKPSISSAPAGVAEAAAKLETLYIPALIRNSMHANGIHHGHKGRSTVVTIDGVEFRFEHEKRVQCGSWVHIATALTGALRVVDEILSCATITGLGVVKDPYAALAAKQLSV
jgi:hypothetical protein